MRVFGLGLEGRDIERDTEGGRLERDGLNFRAKQISILTVKRRGGLFLMENKMK
jgi:hypothetical protein